MCSQTVGLLARELESKGIATVNISLVRAQSEMVKPPRTLFVHWPFAHPLGEPGNRNQQRQVIYDALKLLHTATTPGIIMDFPHKWKQHMYGSVDFADVGQ